VFLSVVFATSKARKGTLELERLLYLNSLLIHFEK
jgi:hypothetical protein